MFAFVYDESKYVLAYATPPFAFALPFDRNTTRLIEPEIWLRSK